MNTLPGSEQTADSEDIIDNTQDAPLQALVEGSEEGELATNPADDAVSIEKFDRSLAEFHRWYKSGRLIIDPEWQRRYVWDRRRASCLIESFLMDIPVPVVYLAKTEEGKYEIIDGVQRLTSVFQFIDDESFRLIGLNFLEELNRKNFKELPAQLQHKLEDAGLRTFELSPKTSKNLLFVIFERLNSGGVALNEMEIRNCIYRGKLNNLIKVLAEFPEFMNSVNQKNIERRMGDRSLVLRFLAFYERTYMKAQSGLKGFLNDFLETYKNASDDKLDDFDKVFKRAMKAAYSVFGDHAFRLRREDRKGGGEWTPRPNASVFQCVSVSFTNYDLSQLTRRADAVEEEFIDLVTTDPTWVDSVSKSTGDPNRIKYTFETWNARLAKCMEGTEPNDKQRCFSKALKQEHFDQDSTCKICGQQIRLLNDAAMDHENHYWRGFKTIPSNARLVHRLCNLQRAKTADTNP